MSLIFKPPSLPHKWDIGMEWFSLVKFLEKLIFVFKIKYYLFNFCLD